MSDNMICITGNVVRPVELKFLHTGTAAVRFSVAVNKKGYNGAEDTTSFFDVECMGSLAENVANSLVLGSRVIVSGELRQRSWDTPEGQKRSVVEVKATSVGPDLRWATAAITKMSLGNTVRPAVRVPALDVEEAF
jgi:single-strand DNA-binding protein